MAEENIKEIFLTSNSLGLGLGFGSAPVPTSTSESTDGSTDGSTGAPTGVSTGGSLPLRGRRRRRTRKSPEESHSQTTAANAIVNADTHRKLETVVVEKTSKQKPIVVLSPPRKKTARILLVSAKTEKADPKKVSDRRKTFRAKRVTVTIDNTAKTAKRKNLLMKQVDGLTEEQLREAVVTAKLARRETVAKVPEKLLRQMLKDYQSIRGAYV